MSWSRLPEVVDGRSPERASALLQKLVITPSTTSSAKLPNWKLIIVQCDVKVDDCFPSMRRDAHAFFKNVFREDGW